MRTKFESCLFKGMKYMRLLRSFSLMACCLAATGCDREETDRLSSNEPTILQLGASINTLTRATDAGFQAGDTLGLYLVKWQDANDPSVLANAGNYADNAWYRLESPADNWQSEQTIYYPSDDNKVDLCAYYPYRTPAFGSGTTIHLNVFADQSSYKAYTRSDFMVAKTSGVKRNPNKVLLTFDHKLSQMVFHLKPGAGFTPSDLLAAKVTVVNAITEASYDLSQSITGTPTAGATRNNIAPCGTWRLEGDSLVGVMAIVVPQELNADTYVQVSLGNRKFTFKPESIHLNSGCSRRFTITVNNTGLDIATSINPWDTCPSVSGEANEDFGNEDVWDGSVATSFCGGTGTQADPYQICSGAALAYLSAQVCGGNPYANVYFKMTCDLDLANLPFTPIGKDRAMDFRGNFDGGGHIIKNLKITGTSLVRVGLFSVLSCNDINVTGSIENLGIRGASIHGAVSDAFIGGIAGEVRYGRVENCFFQGELINNVGVTAGGICGYHFDSTAVFRNCYSIVENLECYEGGAVLGGVYDRGGLVENCYGVLKHWTYTYNVGNFVGGMTQHPADNPLVLKAINNYCDATTCNLDPIGKGDQSFFIATGKTTAELKSSGMPSLLGNAFKQDVDNVNEGYPILKWQ